MKKRMPSFALFALLLLLVSAVSAQTHMEVAVTVVNDRQAPLARASVELMELATRSVLRSTSSAQGLAQFNLDQPGEYELSVNGQVQSSDPVRVLANQKGSTSLFITYNPALQERTRRQTFDRAGLVDIAMPGRVADADVADGYNRIEIEVTNSAGLRLPGRKVCLVDLAGKKRYVTLTNAAGVAHFHLPGKIPYDIDVEEQLNAGYVLQDGLEGYTLSQSVIYDEYALNETRRNDTITQQVQLPIEQKHSRAVYRIHVRRDGKDWANGPVFLDDTHSKTVYKGRTDASGDVVFILPFGKKYLVHFPFERDVDVVNLLDARSIASGTMDLTYVPNPALEHPERFVPTRGQLLLTEFPYYHQAPYPQVPGQAGLTLRTGGARPQTVLEIGLTAGFDLQNSPARNFAFVLDISGSMAGYERIESLKRGLAALIAGLRPQDVVSITLFNDRPRLLLPAQALGRDRDKIIALVQGIEPSGGTDMRQALQIGYQQVARHYNARGTNTVIVLSDGWDGNPVDTLLAVQAPWKDRIHCTAVGVGNDYNYDLLKRLVTQGAELLLQAHEGKELEALFAQKLVSAGTASLREISVEIRTDPALPYRQVFGAKSVTRVPGGFVAALPDLYSGQELPVLASFAAPGASGPVVATVTLRYTDATGKRIERTERIQLTAGGQAAVAAAEATEQRKMYAVAFANSCLLRMADAFAKKNWKEAGQALTEAQSELKLLYPDLKDTDIRKLWDKTAQYANALKNIAYGEKFQL